MSRIHHLTAAFTARSLTCGTHQLRPLTAGSMALLMDSENALFAPAPGVEVGEAESLQALFEFVYIHAAPLEEVIAAAEDPALLRRRARTLGMGISLEDLQSFSEQFSGLQARLNAAAVDILPDAADEKKPAGETAPPTGSPPSSAPSAEQETPPGSTGSSGACPSSAPSNTTTPPMPKTDPAPVGPAQSKIFGGPAIEDEEPIPLP
jgi:hypothetical protein